MTRLSQLRTYPFGLFLCLEWILLGGALLSDLPEEYLFAGYENAQQSLSLAITLSATSMVLVGLMGLRLPKRNSIAAGCYFALELLLLWVPAASGRNVKLSLFIILIIALRNGLLFASKACQKANLILFIASLPMLHDLDTYAEFQARMIEDSARIAAYQTMSLGEYRQLISMIALKNFTQLGLCISLIWVVVNLVLREYRSQQQLAAAREQLRQYALKAEDRATVNERNRIAREIHDSVGHALTAQSIQLTNAIAFWQSDPLKAYEFLCQSHSLVKTALREIRQSVATLRSDPLRGKPLTAAIQQLCHDFAQGSGVQPHLNMPKFSPVSKEIKTTIR
ncbi:MAG: histidine kinase [Cyanobacteria bacterium J06638_38]